MNAVANAAVGTALFGVGAGAMVGVNHATDARRHGNLAQTGILGGSATLGGIAAMGIARQGATGARRAVSGWGNVDIGRFKLKVPLEYTAEKARHPHGGKAVALALGLAAGLGAALVNNHLTGPAHRSDAEAAMHLLGSGTSSVKPYSTNTKEVRYHTREIAADLLQKYNTDRDRASGDRAIDFSETSREVQFEHNGRPFQATASIDQLVKRADQLGNGDGQSTVDELRAAISPNRELVENIDRKVDPTERKDVSEFNRQLGERITRFGPVG